MQHSCKFALRPGVLTKNIVWSALQIRTQAWSARKEYCGEWHDHIPDEVADDQIPDEVAVDADACCTCPLQIAMSQ